MEGLIHRRIDAARLNGDPIDESAVTRGLTITDDGAGGTVDGKAPEVDLELQASSGPGDTQLNEEATENLTGGKSRLIEEAVIMADHQRNLHNGSWSRPAR